VSFFFFQFPLTLYYCSTSHITLVITFFSHLTGQLSQTLSYLMELTKMDYINAN